MTTNQQTFEETLQEMNLLKKEDMAYHKFQPDIPLRLIFPEPRWGQNIVKTVIKTEKGDEFPVLEFKDVVDIEDTTQTPKPLNIGRGASNRIFAEQLYDWLVNRHQLEIEITKKSNGKKGNFETWRYEFFPLMSKK